MWPPSFVEYALRSGIDGVLVSGCRDGDCAYRLGTRWVEARVRGHREPHLRPNVPRQRVCIAWCGRSDGDALRQSLVHFRERLRALPTDLRLHTFKRKEWLHG